MQSDQHDMLDPIVPAHEREPYVSAAVECHSPCCAAAIEAYKHKQELEIDWNEVQHAYKDARIVLLEQDIRTAQDEITEITMDMIDSVVEREFLREDIQRLIDMNQCQADEIKSLRAALPAPAVQPLLPAITPLWDMSRTFKQGDKIDINHFTDARWNGTYVFGADQQFHKVDEGKPNADADSN